MIGDDAVVQTERSCGVVCFWLSGNARGSQGFRGGAADKYAGWLPREAWTYLKEDVERTKRARTRRFKSERWGWIKILSRSRFRFHHTFGDREVNRAMNDFKVSLFVNANDNGIGGDVNGIVKGEPGEHKHISALSQPKYLSYSYKLT